MKKYIIIAILLVPSLLNAASYPVSWFSTTTPTGAITPSRTSAPIQANNFIGISTATSTSNGGWNIASGCFAVNGICVTGGSSTVLEGQVVLQKPDGTITYYNATSSTNYSRGFVLSQAVTAHGEGDTIIVGSGTYAPVSTLTLATSSSLVGTGRPIITTTFTGAPTVTVRNSTTTIRDIYIKTADIGIGYIGSTAINMSGLEIANVEIRPNSVSACGISWTTACNSSAGTNHLISGNIRNSILVGGSLENFGARVNLASGSVLNMINNEVFGATDGVIFNGDAGAIVNIQGGYYTSTLDPITSGGATIYVNGAKARGLSGGTNADLWEDGGDIIAINTDYTSASSAVEGDHRMAGSLLFSRDGDLANLFANSSNVLRTNSSLIVDGKVGIGTTTPGQMLSVAGDILGNNIIGSYFTATSSSATSTFAGGITGPNNFTVQSTTGNVGIGMAPGTQALTIRSGTAGSIQFGNFACTGDYAGFSFNASTPTCGNYNFLSSAGDTTLYINRPSGRNILFRENNGLEQMVLRTGGNLGIGTSTPYAKLSVVGEVVAAGFHATSTGYKASNLTGMTTSVSVGDGFGGECSLTFTGGILTSTTCSEI